MAVNIHLERHNNESTANIMRRFSKRSKLSGIVQKVRGERYFEREKSTNVRHTRRLVKLARQQQYARDYKLGKIDSHSK